MKNYFIFTFTTLLVTLLWGGQSPYTNKLVSTFGFSAETITTSFAPSPPSKPKTTKQLHRRAWWYLGAAFIALYMMFFVMDFIGSTIVILLAATLLIYLLTASFINGVKCIQLNKKNSKKRKGWLPTLISGAALFSIAIAVLLPAIYFLLLLCGVPLIDIGG